MMKLTKQKSLLVIIHFKIHSKTFCQIKKLKSVGNIFSVSVEKQRFYFVLSRKQIFLFVLFYVLKRMHTLSLERGHMWSMVPVARVTMSSVYTCQGQLLHLETIRLSGQRKQTENANYDAQAASEIL